MYTQLIQFVALFLLMMVTCIFWGPWLSLHRSMKTFTKDEFIHIVKVMAANLAIPMRIIMPLCILFISLSVVFYQQKDSFGFYMIITSLCLSIVALLVTILVEVPIVNQIKQWTTASIPTDVETIQDRWLKFHVIRTFASLASFACFAASVLFMH